LYGKHQWEAQVVSVCPKFDLALIVLKDPETFRKALAQRDIKLQPLKLADGSVAMGDDVIAMGFPLGQNSLKISKGNIAGFEQVQGNICIQSTAPISPGNSGGPLLDRAGQMVVGVNFAKATEGENINYVIPAWRVSQMVAHHLKQQPHGQEKPWKRLQVRIPPDGLTIVEGNSALRSLAGCESGVYISKVAKRSFFNKAKPPVPSGAFLVAVNGQELDRFGTGLNGKYIADRVGFLDLFHMVEDITAEVQVQACFQGKTTTHKVSMDWSSEYNQGVRWVDEPHQEDMASAYEMFGDMSIMEMTVNHVSAVLNNLGDPGPARWLHPDVVTQPRLMINYVKQGSYASSVTGVGAAVTKVNGHPVQTLAEFRQHFVPDSAKNVWTLETDMGELVAVMFNETLISQLQDKGNAYLRTQGVVQAAQTLGIPLQGQVADAEGKGAKKMDPALSNARAHLPDEGVAKLVAGLGGNTVAMTVQGSTTEPAPPQVRAAGPVEAQRIPGRQGRSIGKGMSTVWHLPTV